MGFAKWRELRVYVREGALMSHGIYADENRDVRTLVSSEETVEQINRRFNVEELLRGEVNGLGK